MPPFPESLRNKISSYTSVLLERYPPGIVYYKLSVGYTKENEAMADLTPVYPIFTRSDARPDVSMGVWIDIPLQYIFNGDSLWYHVFEADNTNLSYVIKINNSGIITNKFGK